MLELQGPRGEWPWMISVRTGIPLDFYPVFGVHQDSMAMLFLLPALDDGLVDVESAIDASLAWSLGDNELGEPMYGRDPLLCLPLDPSATSCCSASAVIARSLARALVDRPGSLTGGRGWPSTGSAGRTTWAGSSTPGPAGGPAGAGGP